MEEVATKDSSDIRSCPARALTLEALHRFHAFCARFPSQVAESAIKEHSKRGDSVLDPFCGSGTSLVAGLAGGRCVVGADIDILAGLLSEVKCSARSSAAYAKWLLRFADKLREIFADIERRWSPQHLPDEVLGLINNFVLHKISDGGVVDRLTKSISGIDKSQWNMLPGLAPGQALVSLTSMARPLLVSIDPTPCKLRYIE